VLDGPGSNSGGDEIFRTFPVGRDFPHVPGGDEIFRPSRPSLGPTQPPVLYNGYRASPGGKVRSGRAAEHSPPSSAAVMEE